MKALAAVLLCAAAGPARAAAAGPADPLSAAFEQARQDARAFDEEGDDLEFQGFAPLACRKASRAQLAEVDRGNALKSRFLEACAASGAAARWCDEVIRPNPESRASFRCTYGLAQPHQLIDPDPKTWTHAFQALRLVGELDAEGIRVCLINNWWRPEPYNRNVGGARGRHPFGTAVDVKFCTMADKEKAFASLCRRRRQGRLRALGYYPGSLVLHLGVGDRKANTWGKDCPSR